MATIFWDAEGIIMVDYLPKNTTMNCVYYATLITKLRVEVLSKRRGKVDRGILVLQDNAPVHTASVASVTVHESGFVDLEHPSCSPDLTPSDYLLFANLKK